jgi:hypothetical protein
MPLKNVTLPATPVPLNALLIAVDVDVLNDEIELSTLLKSVEVEVDNEATELFTLLDVVLNAVGVVVAKIIPLITSPPSKCMLQNRQA